MHLNVPLLLSSCLAALSTAQSQPLPPSQDPFYTAPPSFQSAFPGTILRMRPAPGNLSAITANASAAYNILYRTTDSQYLPSWAVTTLFVPLNPSNTSGKLLSYQVPYDSAQLDASPSYAMYSAPQAPVEIALGMGWFVTVPDYEGPLASYVCGAQSGYATIDAVRASLKSKVGLPANGTRSALWGYSGGAEASEWAAELQALYAPEMKFAGAALGGLTPKILNVLHTIEGTSAAGLIPCASVGLATQHPKYKAYLAKSLKKSGPYNATTFYSVVNMTSPQALAAFTGQEIANYFITGNASFSDPSFLDVVYNDADLGYHGIPQMPLFAYKAVHDEVSPIADTDALLQRYCGVGVDISYQRNSVGNHEAEFASGEPFALKFLASVLEGTYRQTGCQVQNVTIGM